MRKSEKATERMLLYCGMMMVEAIGKIREWGCGHFRLEVETTFELVNHSYINPSLPPSMSMDDKSQAGPSSLAPGATPYHETSQYRNWRYSPTQLSSIRAELNAKSVEVFTRNSELEKASLSSCFFESQGNKSDYVGSTERNGTRLSTSPSNYLSVGRR